MKNAAQQQALVIGLGQFGMALTEALIRNGLEVVAIDERADRVQRAAPLAAEVARIDATNEPLLARLSPHTRDLCIVAIGDEAREASIIVTALLRQMGAPRIIARATNPIHERILGLVGAHEVVNPERNYGERLATRLAYRSAADILQIGSDLIVTELDAPAKIVGRSLRELALPRRFQVNIIAMRRAGSSGQSRLILPSAEEVVRPGDILVMVSSPAAARLFATQD